jgi:hypothetical protein
VSEGRQPLQRNLDRARDAAAGALASAFAGDELTMEEYEARLDRCYRAASVAEVRDVVADLPEVFEIDPVEGTGAASAGPARPPAEVDRAGHGLVVAVWSGVKRSGSWTPPRHLHAVAVMGGAELDLREARFPEGETTVNVLAVMGGVEIVVPPGLRVQCSGLPLMGGFDSLDQDGAPDVAPGAVLRIRGLACMGGVEVRVAEPGEGA